MKVLSAVATMVLANASLAIADTCAKLSDINSLYRLVAEKKAGDIQIKRLQQEVGVLADGKWGRLSEAAYSALLDRCGSYSYPGEVVQIDNAKVTDFFGEKTVFEKIAVPECVNRRVPVYGEVQAPSDTGAVLGGAIAGGVIGKIVTDSDGGTAVGALIGGAIANESQQNNTVTKVVGYENTMDCKDRYVNMPAKTEKGYAYSTVEFEVDGEPYTLEFKKKWLGIMVKKLFTLFLLLSINIGFANVGLAQIASVEASARPQPTDQEIKNQCALIGNLTFLAIEKFKKGRELDQAKDELSRVAETAFNKEEFAAFSDQLRERYNAAVLDAFLQDISDPKTAAQEQIKDCIRRNL